MVFKASGGRGKGMRIIWQRSERTVGSAAAERPALHSVHSTVQRGSGTKISNFHSEYRVDL